MDFVVVLIIVVLIVGVVIAVIEHRKKMVFLKHDLSLRRPPTEADRDGERAAQAVHEAHQRSLM